MFRALLLVLVLSVLSVPALAAPNVTVTGADGKFPASSTNGLPVTLTTLTAVDVQLDVAGNPISPTNPIFSASDGVATGSITNATQAIAAVDTTVTLSAASRHVTIKTSPDAAITYVSLTGGAATTSSFRVEPGGALSVDLGFAISSYHFLGASATGVISTLGY